MMQTFWNTKKKKKKLFLEIINSRKSTNLKVSRLKKKKKLITKFKKIINQKEEKKNYI